MVNYPSKTLVLCLLAICAFPGGRLLTQAISATADDSRAPGTPAVLQGPSFVPDAKFHGSTLSGWHVMGQAEWSADNGELIGKGTAGPGWLVLDHSYQDTGFYAGFRCVGVCDTGVLIRATKTEGGMRGTFLSIKGTQLTGESPDRGCARQHRGSGKIEGGCGTNSLRSSPARSDRA
jgi:hypothetical protein